MPLAPDRILLSRWPANNVFEVMCAWSLVSVCGSSEARCLGGAETF